MNNEDIRKFRLRLKREYSFVVYKIEDTKKEIDELFDKMAGLKAIDYSKEKGNTNQQAIEEYKLALSDSIAVYEATLKYYQSKLEEMNYVLDKLEDCDKEMFLLKYLKHKTYYQIGKIYYLSSSAVNKRMNKALEEV